MRLPGIDWSQVALSGAPDAPSCSLSPERWASPGQKPGACKGEGRPRLDLWAGFQNPGDDAKGRPLPSAAGEGCTCDDAQTSRPVSPRPNQRTVDGDWLARTLGLDEASKVSLRGRRVAVSPRALNALRSAIRARSDASVTRLKTIRSRREVWPDEQDPRAPLVVAPGLSVPLDGPITRDGPIPWIESEAAHPCDCEDERVDLSPFQGYRFVDAVDGDDDANSGRMELDSSGGLEIKPWRTLAAVERWLNSEIYAELGVAAGTCIGGAAVLLAVGQTWDGTEGDDDWSVIASGAAALHIEGFKGASDAPLLIASWDPTDPTGDVPAAGSGPLIQGTPTGSANVPYADERVGLHLEGCCHVTVTKLRVRGFATGVKVTGASRYIDLTDLSLKNHAIFGVYIGVPKADADAISQDAQEALDTLDAEGAYPAFITVSDCKIRSIGYNTAGGDIMLGPLATNCTIASNHLYGDEERGVDGIVSDGGSSGHLIEKNYIYTHNKFCVDHTGATEVVSEFVSSTTLCGSSGDHTLVHPCADRGETAGACNWDDNGYYRYYDSAGTTMNGSEAFGENGIDLKGVRPRTSASRPQTIIRRNRIWGHRWRTGVQIDDGSREIYVYRNRIFSNGSGIMVTNSKNADHDTGETKWWDVWDVTRDDDRATKGVYIYRNLVYLNLERGIVIKSGQDGGGYNLVSEVYVVNNTVAHNGETGLAVVVEAVASGAVTAVHVLNNLFARNGILAPRAPDTGEPAAMQVYWDGDMLGGLDAGTSLCDYNCYLSWDRSTVNPEEDVIRLGSDWATVADVYTKSGLLVETHGVQPTSLSALYLTGQAAIMSLEGADTGSGLLGYYIDPSTGDFVVDVSDRTIPYTCDYDIADTASILCTMDSTTAGVTHYRSTRDLSLSPDYKGDSVTDGEADIGAYEGPAE